MAEQFITFKTAKLAKEKGFKEWCNIAYTEYLETQIDPEYPEGGGPFGFNKGDIEIESAFNHNNSIKDPSHYATYSAPIQSDLQKWILDTHKILIGVIHWDLDHQKFTWFADLTFSKFKEIDDDDDTKFETFEDAFEHALQTVLNLL